jgi:hypothetical protein
MSQSGLLQNRRVLSNLCTGGRLDARRVLQHVLSCQDTPYPMTSAKESLSNFKHASPVPATLEQLVAPTDEDIQAECRRVSGLLHS